MKEYIDKVKLWLRKSLGLETSEGASKVSFLRTSEESGQESGIDWIFLFIVIAIVGLLVYVIGWAYKKFFKKSTRRRRRKSSGSIISRVKRAVSSRGKGSQYMKNKMARLRKMRGKKKKK